LTLEAKLRLSYTMIDLLDQMLRRSKIEKIYEVVNYYEREGYDVSMFLKQLKEASK